eukprot:282822-Chlamydomonas_euryale.AAC.8
MDPLWCGPVMVWTWTCAWMIVLDARCSASRGFCLAQSLGLDLEQAAEPSARARADQLHSIKGRPHPGLTSCTPTFNWGSTPVFFPVLDVRISGRGHAGYLAGGMQDIWQGACRKLALSNAFCIPASRKTVLRTTSCILAHLANPQSPD